jgi:hypothetical protein
MDGRTKIEDYADILEILKSSSFAMVRGIEPPSSHELMNLTLDGQDHFSRRRNLRRAVDQAWMTPVLLGPLNDSGEDTHAGPPPDIRHDDADSRVTWHDAIDPTRPTMIRPMRSPGPYQAPASRTTDSAQPPATTSATTLEQPHSTLSVRPTHRSARGSRL